MCIFGIRQAATVKDTSVIQCHERIAFSVGSSLFTAIPFEASKLNESFNFNRGSTITKACKYDANLKHSAFTNHSSDEVFADIESVSLFEKCNFLFFQGTQQFIKAEHSACMTECYFGINTSQFKFEKTYFLNCVTGYDSISSIYMGNISFDSNYTVEEITGGYANCNLVPNNQNIILIIIGSVLSVITIVALILGINYFLKRRTVRTLEYRMSLERTLISDFG